MKANHARVVIVGGGIMGASLAYHLCREGWSDVVLLEKGELTSGSTWHAAGQITHSLGSYTIAKMAGYGIELYDKLETETEQSVTFHKCGSLRVAYSDDEVDYLRFITSVGAVLGHPMEIIGPSEIAKIHPFYNLDGIQAALHTPADGHVDPAGATFALAKGARQMGARVIRHNRVTDIRQTGSGEWRVITEKGEWIAEMVVNAAGTYARQVGAWSGLDLPVVSATHHYLVTETAPELLERDVELPVVRDDALVSGYVRQEQKSGLIGIYEKCDPREIWTEGTPWESENELFDADYDRIMPWLEAALERMPILSNLGIKRVVHGAIAHPPDGLMMLGPAPGLTNYWCACGIPVGIAWGPGAGKYLAQWMVHGAADINMRAFDPRRFGDWASHDYAITKVKEDYVLRHETPYPHRDRPAGRPVRTTTIHNELTERGAVFEQVFGWERPFWYAPQSVEREHILSFRRSKLHDIIGAEARAVREKVGIGDFSAFAKLEVSGRDAEVFLERMCSNRMPRKIGRISLTPLLTESGRIEAETTVVKLGDDHYYLVLAAVLEVRAQDWLKQHVRQGEDVAIANVSDDYGVLVIAGPKSRDLLRRVAHEPLDNDTFPWLTARDIEIAGRALRALRVSFTGELAWELHVPMSSMKDVYGALWKAGQPLALRPFGSLALNSLRMEKAYKTGHELTNEVTIAEADAMRFARLDKDYIGAQVTRREAQSGPRKWCLAYLEVEGSGDDCLGSEAVYLGDKIVGAVSSGGYGHVTGKSLAFAYLAPSAAAPGTRVEVNILGDRRTARVLSEAVWDPQNERMRQ